MHTRNAHAQQGRRLTACLSAVSAAERRLLYLVPLFRACRRVLSTLLELDMLVHGEMVTAAQLTSDVFLLLADSMANTNDSADVSAKRNDAKKNDTKNNSAKSGGKSSSNTRHSTTSANSFATSAVVGDHRKRRSSSSSTSPSASRSESGESASAPKPKSASASASERADALLHSITVLATLEGRSDSAQHDNNACIMLNGSLVTESEQARAVPWEACADLDSADAEAVSNGAAVPARAAYVRALGTRCGDEAQWRPCVQANSAWDARQWLSGLLTPFEQHLLLYPEQQRIVSDCFAQASAALRRACEQQLTALTTILIESVSPHLRLLYQYAHAASPMANVAESASKIASPPPCPTEMEMISSEEGALQTLQEAILRMQCWLFRDVLRLLMQRLWVGLVAKVAESVGGGSDAVGEAGGEAAPARAGATAAAAATTTAATTTTVSYTHLTLPTILLV
eukprot:5155357-Pleurochrysis_carterae.AAC.1